MEREWLKRGKGQEQKGEPEDGEAKRSMGGKLQMQTQELEHTRGPISRRLSHQTDREPAQGKDGEQDWI